MLLYTRPRQISLKSSHLIIKLFIRHRQVVPQCEFSKKLELHIPIKVSCSNQESFFEFSQTIRAFLTDGYLTQELVHTNDALQHLNINQVALSFFFNLVKDCFCNLREKFLQDMHFKLLETLICQICDAACFHVVSIQVLKEFLHPLDEDLMVAPSRVKLSQEFLTTQLFKLWHHLKFNVFNKRLRILFVKLCLKCFNRCSAQIVNCRVKLHVFLLGEHHLFLSWWEVVFNSLDSISFDFKPLWIEFLVIVNYNKVLAHRHSHYYQFCLFN